jgi:hypothetical protein
MLRRSTFSWSKDAAEVARAIAQRKKNWINRRRTPNPNRKEFYAFDEMPACVLCQRRFMYKQDYQVHKESRYHKDRVRWTEMVEWYHTEGLHMKRKSENELWKGFKNKIIKPQAQYAKEPMRVACTRYRTGLVNVSASTGERTDVPPVAAVVREPRDQRWPSSPKH